MTKDASDPRFYQASNRPAFLEIHAGDPVYYVEARFTQPFWNVCSHDLIRDVGKDAELFTTQHGVHLNAAAFAVESAGEPPPMPDDPRLLQALTPANILPERDHRRVRGPVNPHFRHDVVGRLEPEIRAMLRRVLDEIEPGAETDFMAAFATRVPLLVTTRLLGVDPAREHDFERWANAVLSSFEPGAVPDWHALGEMVEFFGSEIAARRAAPREDLISELLATTLSDEEVLMWCWLLLVAGLETTGNLIGGGMHLLLEHPDQRDRVLEDRELVRPAVAEMLRVVTPGRYIRRTATADTEIGGHAIAAGDPVVMNFTVANFDPAMFDDPLRFDVERRPNEALAFSYGPHRCIGMSVARLEATIAFEELLARFPGTELRGEAEYRPSLATAVCERLPVAFRP